MKPQVFLFLISAVLGAISGRAADKLVIYVPVLPYEFIFERIGGDLIEVHAIVPEHGDPHNYSPSPRQLTQISKANLIFSGGLLFESNFFTAIGDGINSPKKIDLLEGLDLLEESCHDHEHLETEKSEKETDREQAQSDLRDPHVWLSPRFLLLLSERVATILKQHLPPESGVRIEENLAAFQTEVKDLDEALRAELAPMKGSAFYVYHGAFAYFALDYGLEQKVIETAGRNPTPRQVAAIAKQAQEEGVKVIFVQPQFDESSALSLAKAIGGTVRTLDPLEKDIFANLRLIARTIAGEH